MGRKAGECRWLGGRVRGGVVRVRSSPRDCTAEARQDLNVLLGVREAASKGLNPRQTSGTQRVKVFEGPYTIHHSVGGLHTTRGGAGGAAGGANIHDYMTMAAR